MTKFIRLMACSITLTCIFAAAAQADVTKRQFAADIQEYIVKTLSSFPRERVHKPDEKLIAERAAALAKAINLIPGESIDDATAKWIKESIAYFLMKPSWSNDPNAGFSTALEVFQARFKVLTPEKAADFLALRDKEIIAAKVYRAEYIRWLASKLSKGKLIEVQFDLPVAPEFTRRSDLQVPRLDAFVLAMGYPSYFVEPYYAPESINLESSPIDSQLLVHALAYTVQQQMKYHAWYDELTIKNLTSRIYAEDHVLPDELKSFQDVLPDLEKLSQQCLVQKQDTLMINYERFQDMVWQGHIIRKMKEFKPKEVLPPDTRFQITFANNVEAWKLLEEANLPE